MGNRSVIGIRGLNTSDNPLSLEPGTLIQADNVVVRNRGAIEPRRGEYSAAAMTGLAQSIYVRWRDSYVVHLDTNKLGRSGADYTGTFTEVDPGRRRVRFVEALKNLYFTANEGVHFVHTVGSAPVRAGVPRAPDLNFEFSILTNNPNVGWMPANSQVTGRSLFGIKDANGNLKLGAPSGPLIIINPADQTIAIGGLVRTGGVTVTVTFPAAHGYRAGDVIAVSGSGDANFPNGNRAIATVPSTTTLTYTEGGANAASTTTATISSGSKDIVWRVTLPPDITSSHFFRLYRGNVSSGASIAPDDELFLVFEGAITAGNITAGYVEYTDRTPESVLGLFGSSPLYTNANTGDGALAARFRPPKAQDIAWWDNRLWFANTIDVGRRTLTLLGIGSPAGLQDGDTLTVDVDGDSEVFTARASPAATNDFKLYTTGTASQNIERTARALVAKVHVEHGSARAYYASAANEAPGSIQFETEPLGSATTGNLFITASRLTCWSPLLPAGVGSDQQKDERTNGLSYSELGQPEGVPPVNFLETGASTVEISRILPLRDKLVVLTKNGGTWLVSGPAPYRVDALDPTADCDEADSAVVHAGQVYALTSQGVVIVSEAGVRIISQPIEESLASFQRHVEELTDYRRAFGVSRETLHEYQLWLPGPDTLGTTDPTCVEAFIYNSLYGVWTRRTGNRTCGQDGILGSGDVDALLAERGYTQALSAIIDDPADRLADSELAVTITNANGRVITLSSVAGITAGDMLYQAVGDSLDPTLLRAVIEEVDTVTSQVTVATTESFQAGSAAKVLIAFECVVKFAPDTGGAPGLTKHVREAALHFKRLLTYQQDITNNPDAGFTNATFETEAVPVEKEVRLDNGGFGLKPYGSSLWGDPSGPVDERVAVAQQHQRARQMKLGFRIRQARASWELCGYSLEGEAVSERTR